MENENDIQETEETSESLEVAEETGGEAADLATKLSEAEKRIKELEIKAIKQREKTKELKAKTVTEVEKPNELNDGQKALFVSYGIKSKDEIALGKELMDRLQINSVETLIEDDYFQSRLAKLRDAKATQEAVPVNTGRSASSVSNRIEYWQSRPFNEVPKELRQEVLNARLKANEQKQKFGS